MLQLEAQWRVGYRTAKATDEQDQVRIDFFNYWSAYAQSVSDDPELERSAWDQGSSAYRDGQSLDDNPHTQKGAR